MPFRTVFCKGVKSLKSDFLFEMQLVVPISTQIGCPPGVKLMSFSFVSWSDCQAWRYSNFSWLVCSWLGKVTIGGDGLVGSGVDSVNDGIKWSDSSIDIRRRVCGNRWFC
jgi:hypothetical protein